LLTDNPELALDIEKKIKAKYLAGVEVVKVEPLTEDEKA
jgi:hypothetical protein